MRDHKVQTITAYECKLHTPNKSDIQEYIEFSQFDDLLREFITYLKIPRTDGSRAIVVDNSAAFSKISDDARRMVIHPEAGKDGIPFAVMNTGTRQRTEYDENNTAIYNHNVFCYYKKGKVFFVFHRNGLSGCKTVFFNVFNNFLKEKNLRVKFLVKFSSKMFEENDKYLPQTLTLINKIEKSDPGSQALIQTKDIEEEKIIHLSAPKFIGIRKLIKDFVLKLTGQDETISLIETELEYPFHEAKVTVKIGNVTRTISLNEFTGLLAEYDITDKLEYNNKRIVFQSLLILSDDYFSTIWEENI